MPRIRLQTNEPLPTLKAWFLVPNDVKNIAYLKLILCSQISALKEVNLQPAQLALEMDDFEVLDESPIDVVREADVLTLKRREVVSQQVQTLKRKFDSEDTTFTEIKRYKFSNKAAPSVSTSSASSGTSSTSDSTSSSSSSSSDSYSDPSLSPGSAPSTAPTKKKPFAKATMAPLVPVSDRSVPPATIQQPAVPPGLGKPSTKARNNRRKIKRMFTAGKSIYDAASTSAPTFDNHGDEIAPYLPYDDTGPGSVSAPSNTVTHNLTLSSLGNKNKRKGFKKSMEGVLPQKLVFDSTLTPTFIPPSEREVLPYNMFVTSVDVGWRTGKGHWQEEAEEGGTESVAGVGVPQVMDSEPDWGSANWTAVEAGWDKYAKIEAATDVLPGRIVAWKGFGLDPVTLTPQASLLHLARVVALDVETLIVTPLLRPGTGPAAFGRAQIGEEEDRDSTEKKPIPLVEVLSNDWRLLPTQ